MALLRDTCLVLLGAAVALFAAIPFLPLLGVRHLAPALTPAMLPPKLAYEAVLAGVAHLDAVQRTLTPPNLLLWRHTMGFLHTSEIYAAASLSLADFIHDKGGAAGLPIAALAAASTPCAAAPADAAASCGQVELRLARLLRALAAFGVFREAAPLGSNVWLNSPLSEFLRTDHVDSMRAVALTFGGVQFRMMGELPAAIALGESSFSLVHGSPFWDWYAAHAPEHGIFDTTMRQLGRIGGADAAIARDVPWASLVSTIVDVGGGHGEMLAGIITANPRLSRGIVFDMPHVVKRALNVWYPELEEKRLASALEVVSRQGTKAFSEGVRLDDVRKATEELTAALQSEAAAAAAELRAATGAFNPAADPSLQSRVFFVSGDMFNSSTVPSAFSDLATTAAQGQLAIKYGSLVLAAANAGRNELCSHELPSVGYVLRDILHDWNDEDSVRILASLRRSMRATDTVCYALNAKGPEPSAPRPAPVAAQFPDRVLIVARVLDLGADFVRSVGSYDADITMLAAFGTTAGERTRDHFARLLQRAGLEIVTVHSTRSHYKVVEARALALAPAAEPAAPVASAAAEVKQEL